MGGRDIPVEISRTVLLNIISIIAGVFIYFNLNEKKNFTGTYERIQSLGGNRD